MFISIQSKFTSLSIPFGNPITTICLTVLPYSKRNLSSFIHHSPISSSLKQDDSTNPPSSPNPKQSQLSYEPPEELFGLSVDPQPRKLVSSASKPRSWFGPNGQYIRELPCPSCRGIERCRADCSLCNGKGLLASPQCLGDCVIWEESIDERPWEASSVSPLKVKEDDEVDNLDIQLNVRRKTKRVYHSPTPEVNMKISRSLKKAKGTPAARRQASEAKKKYFRDPENRRKRSIAMKGVKFYCSNCRREGHRRNYCPELPHDLRIDSSHAGYVVKRVIIEEHARSQN